MPHNRCSTKQKVEPWSVDIASGHCASGTGLHACFDPKPTTSGAIKAIGPFGVREENIVSVTQQMRLATLAIEEAVGGYVVWGEYYDIPEYQELQISVLGEIYGFYPNIALRSSLFFKQPCEAKVHQREWIFSEHKVGHRSNGLISNQEQGPLDLEVLHPNSFENQLKILKITAGSFFGCSELELAKQICGWRQINLRHIG